MGDEFQLEGESAGTLGTFEDYDAAFAAMKAAAAEDIEEHGETEARESGALTPYGYSIQVYEDGENITETWKNNRPHKPLHLS
ncbi:hypothetical protein [Streptomyces sp. 4F14]|uniref:hypothetical protein n=1 Tax=Streptomyces sp. 4F14 TaxID=3394380 RepID=UPI003A86D34B